MIKYIVIFLTTIVVNTYFVFAQEDLKYKRAVELEYRYKNEIEQGDYELVKPSDLYKVVADGDKSEKYSINYKDYGIEIKKENGFDIILQYDDKKILREKTIIQNRKKNGIRQIYYSSGILQQEIPYLNDKISGVKKCYHENGKLAITTTYVDGKREGDRIFYFFDTTIVKAIVPYKNNVISGVVRKFEKTDWHQAYLKYKASFFNGLAHGKWETFESYYKPMIFEGKEIGLFTTYRKREENNVNGTKTGKDIQYTPDSTIWCIAMYNNGIIQYEDFFAKNGSKLHSNIFLNGKQVGNNKVYNNEGKLIEECKYINGIKTGKSVEYWDNGNLRKVEFYNNGKLTDSAKAYVSNGKLSRQVYYNKVNGKISCEKKYEYDGGLLREERLYNDNGTEVEFRLFRKLTGEKYFVAKELGVITIEANYYSKKGDLIWSNKYKDGKGIGIQKGFDEATDQLSNMSFFDNEGNGYNLCFTAYCIQSKIDEKYYIKDNVVTKDEFLTKFEIKDGVVLKK